ncbi:MAG TPA: hypothetical protein VFS51_09160 [Gemmatimonadales bacterium]|nr:hypothetical protein [Gemmatimonadales bacterium]
MCPSPSGLLVISLALTTGVLNVAHAQSPASPGPQTGEMRTPQSTNLAGAKRAEKKKNWRVSPAFRVHAEFDNNVFLLSASRKDNVADPSAEEVISGRYTDMESAHDVLTTMSAGLSVKGPGLFGRSSVITPEVAYELYAQNTERRNVSLALALQQNLSSGSRLRVRGRLTPSYFVRNYMADAVDQDLSGSITPEERVYERGEYGESEFGADYRIRLSKSSKRHPFGASLQLGGGFYDRSYDAPLSGRDLSGPTMDAKLRVDLGRRISLEVGYDYSSLGAEASNQVLLIDEPEVGEDLNGNGNTTDLDTRVLTMADRSRREHSLGASLQLALSKPADLTLGYEHRWRRYTSQESLDVVNRGRRDARDQMSADLKLRVARDLRMRLGGSYSVQDLNRSEDTAGEIDDYTRAQARLGLSYEL